MADRLALWLEEGGALVVEAGTGTGKTLAYLVPAVLSGERVVVSTGTRTLQDQIAERDLEILGRALGRPVSAAVLKGRENYLCLRRFARFAREPLFEQMGEVEVWPLVRDWAERTNVGDRSELGDLPDDARFWRSVDARSEACTGSACEDYERCFLVRAKRRAAESQIVVVNHALFFADLALRTGEFGAVLPEYERVVLDEAHLVEEMAGRYFGTELSSFQIEALAGDAATVLRKGKGAAAPAEALNGSGEGLFTLLRSQGPERRRFYPGRLGAPLGEAVEALLGALDRLRGALEGEGAEAEERGILVRRCSELSRALRFLAAASDPAHVYWTEARGRGMLLASVPIDLAPVLGERLFAGCGVALTSATLSVAGRFDFVRERLGVEEAGELLVPSPFDHSRQAVLYLPPRMPDPAAPEFLPRAVEEMAELLEITRGRALLLFTSHANLRAAAEALRERVPFPVLVQGEAPQRVLLERLRSEPGTVLLGTNSFRQGVDVPGEALSLVVLDRLPFSVPDEPLVAARGEDLRRKGRNPFTDYQLPTAVIALKQALGRLLRHSRDRGVLAVMDPRLRSRPYGKTFLASLPPHPLVEDLEEVRRFFAGPGPG